MPAYDNSARTAETEFNIDANPGVAVSTTAVNLGRAGLPGGAVCVVEISEASAANFNAGSARTAWADFEYTTDNSTWRKGGSVSFECDASGLPKQVREMHVTMDIVPEQHAASDIDWRVTFNLSANFAATNADNFNFIGYLFQRTGAVGLQD